MRDRPTRHRARAHVCLLLCTLCALCAPCVLLHLRALARSLLLASLAIRSPSALHHPRSPLVSADASDYFSNKHKYGGSSSSSSSSSAGASKADSKKLSALFEEYRGRCEEEDEEDMDVMDGANLARFFEALGLNTAGPGPLALAWQYRCATFATLERKEFTAYYTRLGIDTLAAMKADARRVEELLKDKKQFKDFYRWLFEFAKEEEERKTIGQPACRRLPVLVAQRSPIDGLARRRRSRLRLRALLLSSFLSVLLLSCFALPSALQTTTSPSACGAACCPCISRPRKSGSSSARDTRVSRWSHTETSKQPVVASSSSSSSSSSHPRHARR